jgi:phytoene dehydrogenase-like protein
VADRPVADRIVVIGGGVGGMVAALRARRLGAEVCLVEARGQLGGLASGLRIDGTTFDGGPYILLDRRRLGWALEQVGIDLSTVPMDDLDPTYRVRTADNRTVTVFTDLERTCDSLSAIEQGAGEAYRSFVRHATKGLEHLAPLLIAPHDPVRFVTSGAWRSAGWALRSLDGVLRHHGLTGIARPVVQIWTLIAGADIQRAPGPMAFVPALIHRDGAARPVGGIHRIIDLLEAELVRTGVQIVRNAPVAAITLERQRVTGVRLEDGTDIEARTVISDVGGATALLDLVDVRPPPAIRRRLAGPLQSPGVTAYLRVRGQRSCEINFRVDGDPLRARAFIHPTAAADGWSAGRLVAPLGADDAARLGSDGQRELLDRYVAETWWRDGIDEVEVVHRRLVGDWGRTFRLRSDAMNLVMARRQMLLGRLPHRIKHLPGLYLTGSWTHPGQWISFCSVSGVLAADQALKGHG